MPGDEEASIPDWHINNGQCGETLPAKENQTVCPLCSSFQKEVRLFSHLAISPGDNFSRGALPSSQKLLPCLQMNELDVMITVVCLNFYHSIPCLCSDMSSGLYVTSAWYFVYKVILWSLIFTGASRERHYCDLHQAQGVSSISESVRLCF